MQGKIDSSTCDSCFQMLIFTIHWPKNEVERLLYDFCEQVRIESQVPSYLKGVTTSIQFNFCVLERPVSSEWLHRITNRHVALFTLMQVIHTRFNRCSSFGTDCAKPLNRLAPASCLLLGTAWKRLKQHRTDQQQFAHCANELAAPCTRANNPKNKRAITRPRQQLKKTFKILAQLALVWMVTFKMKTSIPTSQAVAKVFELSGANYQVLIQNLIKSSRQTNSSGAPYSRTGQKLTDDIMARQVSTRRLAAMLRSLCCHSSNEPTSGSF